MTGVAQHPFNLTTVNTCGCQSVYVTAASNGQPLLDRLSRVSLDIWTLRSYTLQSNWIWSISLVPLLLLDFGRRHTEGCQGCSSFSLRMDRNRSGPLQTGIYGTMSFFDRWTKASSSTLAIGCPDCHDWRDDVEVTSRGFQLQRQGRLIDNPIFLRSCGLRMKWIQQHFQKTRAKKRKGAVGVLATMARKSIKWMGQSGSQGTERGFFAPREERCVDRTVRPGRITRQTP
ncbi:MAG: hypothetical protein J3Q66DRAFT_57764 [Benniella sp.]|nr:MAG: hypothetical protein J3Q66DRAFT_57764 [Benniella sp.]